MKFPCFEVLSIRKKMRRGWKLGVQNWEICVLMCNVYKVQKGKVSIGLRGKGNSG